MRRSSSVRLSGRPWTKPQADRRCPPFDYRDVVIADVQASHMRAHLDIFGGLSAVKYSPQSVVSALGERVIGQIYPRAIPSSGASAVKMGSRSDDGSAFTTR
jgi:hypothetical protein